MSKPMTIKIGIEKRLRHMTDSQLAILHLILTSEQKFVLTSAIKENITVVGHTGLGGALSSLVRGRIPFIKAVGRTKHRGGVRWALSDHVLPYKEAMLEIVNEIRSYK